MADFRELMKMRRAVRDYEDREVPVSLIREIIIDACEAPSGGNRQPWGFAVVTDRELMKRLSDESKRNLLEDMKTIRSPILRMYRPVLSKAEFNVYYNAPCLVFITGLTGVHSAPADCSLAAAYFMLSAADRGLGTCWIGLGSHIKDRSLLDEMGIPENHRIISTLILGYPRTLPAKPPRNAPKIFRIIG
ncbi:MAG TPA: nitroreductase family protein [Deltaproteobacteria bacterium]|jgi:nitroreductase|nr:nitroreductase family protein [Deltaproteobacteria bacterium]HQI02664.1 nitroreductase family protein [Deltaproteobacteria bacterium]HQJ09462.1 nitroreductase family protein [Deltaproteobacteria bacterium]